MLFRSNESIFNFVANHLNLATPLSPSQSLFAWKCLVHAANTGNTLARWLFAQVVVGKSVGRPVLAFSELTESQWSDLGGIDHFKNLALRYLEELSDLPSFEDHHLAGKLLSECLLSGSLGVTDVSRAKKIIGHLATKIGRVHV